MGPSELSEPAQRDECRGRGVQQRELASAERLPPPADLATVEVTYYTDPLCAWSWALEPQWRRLRYEYGNQLQWHYRMAAMIPHWDRFHDPVHAVSRPAQMAPLWLQISEMTDAPLDHRLWTTDPPASSIPACMAVKAAEQQGAWTAEAYLRRLREAAMLQRRNIARDDVLVEVAEDAAGDLPPAFAMDVSQWKRMLHDEVTRDALRDDLRQLRYYEIDRFPTLLLRRPGSRAIACVGYRDFDSLRDALCHVAPEIQPQRETTLAEYAAYWGRLTRRELAEALQIETSESGRLVERATERGELANVEILC